jgi:hypothetical protein
VPANGSLLVGVPSQGTNCGRRCLQSSNRPKKSNGSAGGGGPSVVHFLFGTVQVLPQVLANPTRTFRSPSKLETERRTIAFLGNPNPNRPTDNSTRISRHLHHKDVTTGGSLAIDFDSEFLTSIRKSDGHKATYKKLTNQSRYRKSPQQEPSIIGNNQATS